MKNVFYEGECDAVVVGAGHAGCEAALALSRMGFKTILFTTNMENIAFLACNPSIGGTAKGHIVREIDALGGEMGINADNTCLQMKMLNMGKGPAVHSLRAQADKFEYHKRMKKVLENTDNLFLRQGEVAEIEVVNGKVEGVITTSGIQIKTKTVILATGVYLKSDIIYGDFKMNIGPSGFAPCNALTKNLLDLGFEIRRFKTGTPARVDKRTIDFSKMEKQDGDTNIYPFSFMTDGKVRNDTPCYLAYTNSKTHEIIRENLHRSPLYSGIIKGVGPRYCPSIEDKVVRFSDKERHQIFIEPEGGDTNEVYVQGMSTSLPADVQLKLYRSISGMENAHIVRNAYAIEYDCINPEQLKLTLGYKNIEGIFTAGQINGTSGYEEAAGQGLIAGINAGQFLKGKKQIVLKRSDAYIGVLIDDITTKGTFEPYRMMTSRAEYRLHLRQDNADLRLTEIGRSVGLVSDERYERFTRKQEQITQFKKQLERNVSPKIIDPLLEKVGATKASAGQPLSVVLKRNEVSVESMAEFFGFDKEFTKEVMKQAEIEIKYEGYLESQKQEIQKAKKLEEKFLPQDFDYSSLKGLRIEAMQKLNKIKPANFGQASRISGVSPADIAVLMMWLKKDV